MVVIGCVLLFVSGWLTGRSWERLRQPMAPPMIDLRWTSLPSGWSKSFGPLTIYAMTQDRRAYWWVARNGKTIIEGPAGTLEIAKLEAEREARELSL